MTARKAGQNSPDTEQTKLIEIVRTIATGDAARALALLDAAPHLATVHATVGASAESVDGYFFTEIQHYLYAGDTALHIAAAAYDAKLANRLMALGADCHAKNRRGAEPLHYASDTNHEGPKAQARTIECLGAAGANPNALDQSGVAPLHRAVRTRGAEAVKALLTLGADPRLKNKSGSTPLHLAVQTTGRGGTGEARALARQQEIIELLLEHGAKPTDKDGRGKTVTSAAKGEAVLALLRHSSR